MKAGERTFTFVIKEAEEGGYLARCIELPQVHTEGETMEEVRRNMRDALNLAIDHFRAKAKKEKGRVVEITVR